MLVAAGETGVEAVPARPSGREETPVRPGRQAGNRPGMSWTRMVIRRRAADPENPSPQGADAVRLYGQSSELPKDLTGLELVAGLDREAPRPEMRIQGAIAATDVLHDVVAAALGEQHAAGRTLHARGASPPRVRRVYLTGRSGGRRLDSCQARVGG